MKRYGGQTCCPVLWEALVGLSEKCRCLQARHVLDGLRNAGYKVTEVDVDRIWFRLALLRHLEARCGV